MNESIHIRRNSGLSRFEVDTPEGVAILEYTCSTTAGKRSIDFTRTYVPPDARGQGVAERLVRHGLSWAKSEGAEIHASCWYVAKFLKPASR